MNATIETAAAAIRKATRRHEYALTALIKARNAGRPTAYLTAEVESARSEWVLAEVAGQQLLARRIEARS